MRFLGWFAIASVLGMTVSACGPEVFEADPQNQGSEVGAGGKADSAGGTGTPCGGRMNLQCAADEYCNYPEVSQCGANDMTGVCTDRPAGCPADCPGACGCDGVTYCSACMAARAGVDVSASGQCETPSCADECAAGAKECGTGNDYRTCGQFDSDTCLEWSPLQKCGAEESCNLGVCVGTSSGRCGGLLGETCESDEFCDYPETSQCGANDMIGVCRDKQMGCTADCPGVCGCDLKTYCNGCMANVAGVDVLVHNPCFSAEDTLARCSDKYDNDQNGFIDCADYACSKSTIKEVAEYCAAQQ